MLTQSRLKELLEYNTETGIFTRKISIGSRGMSGNIVGTNHGGGYLTVQIDKKLFYLHRLAWLFVHGEFPKKFIDHIDHNKKNNKIKNLREVSKSGNGQNQIKVTSRNKGANYLGVSFDKRRGVYYAKIQNLGIQKYLGTFETQEDAFARYLEEKRIIHRACTI